MPILVVLPQHIKTVISTNGLALYDMVRYFKSKQVHNN